MKQEDVLREVKTYMEQAKRRLVCSKKSKRDFCRALEASAEEYLQMDPHATVEGLRAYLGAVSYTHLDVYKRQTFHTGCFDFLESCVWVVFPLSM